MCKVTLEATQIMYPHFITATHWGQTHGFKGVVCVIHFVGADGDLGQVAGNAGHVSHKLFVLRPRAERGKNRRVRMGDRDASTCITCFYPKRLAVQHSLIFTSACVLPGYPTHDIGLVTVPNCRATGAHMFSSQWFKNKLTDTRCLMTLN